MTIYPDPELPDVAVEWLDTDCRPGTGDVALTLVGVDDPSFRAELRVPCSDLEATFADVPRERFRLEATRYASSGEASSMYNEQLDLRDGLDARSFVLFDIYNVRVAWSFDMGASCASLGAKAVLVELSPSSVPDPITLGVPCELTPVLAQVPDGLYTITARAVAGQTTLAVSPPSAELAISADAFTDAGTLVMSPCGAACP